MENILDRILKRYNLEKKLWLIRSNQKVFKPEEQILIFSDPRGGSTWLAEMINTIPNTTILWEPLHLKYIYEFKRLGFSWRQFIPENIEWPEAKNVFDKVLSGKILNEWTLLKTDVKTYKEANQQIVKICRGNALLPWIVNQYSFRFKPLYLVRNPFAVVSSQLKHGGWNHLLDGFKVFENPYNHIYLKNHDFLRSLNSIEESLTVLWCLTNKVALESKHYDKFQIVHYEDLVKSPINVLRRIFKDWGMKIPDEILDKIDQKSSTSIKTKHNTTKNDYLTGWKKTFNENQKQNMINIIEYFEMSETLPKDYVYWRSINL